jgi:hypothetical protein
MATRNTGVYIFWDNSNLYIPAQFVCASKDGLLHSRSIRLHFSNLYNLAHAGRPVKKSVAVGSVPPEQQALWTSLEQNTGIKIKLYKRGGISGREEGVDENLQADMQRALIDETEPQIAVLLTGDGAGYQDGKGFHVEMERMYKKGWGIEVLSWDRSCSGQLKAWAQQVGVFVRLDDYYEAVTFLDGTRKAKALNLTRRKKAVTH